MVYNVKATCKFLKKDHPFCATRPFLVVNPLDLATHDEAGVLAQVISYININAVFVWWLDIIQANLESDYRTVNLQIPKFTKNRVRLTD